MLGYVPQLLPQAYVQSGGPGLGRLGDAGIVGSVLSLFSSGSQSAAGGSNVFNTALQQIQAQQLADERSRNWKTVGIAAAGIAGLAGVVYLLRRKK